MAKKKTSTVSTRLLTATMVIFFLLSGSVLCILASTFAVTINYSMNSSWITFIFTVFVLSLTCAILLLVTIKKVKKKAKPKPKPEKPSPESGNNSAVTTTEKTGAVNETNSPDDDDDSDDDDDTDNDDDSTAYERNLLKQKENSEVSVRDSVIARMNMNLSKISKYYKWSQDQAKAMFIASVSICIAGFGMIAASLLLSVFLKLNFEAALFTAIGGMVTEVFGGTTLLVYRSSVSQLNYYHKSLHEDQRFLYATELTVMINDIDVKDKMLEAIIRNALRINLVLAKDKEEEPEKKKAGTTESEQSGTTDASGQTTASNASGSEEKPKKP